MQWGLFLKILRKIELKDLRKSLWALTQLSPSQPRVSSRKSYPFIIVSFLATRLKTVLRKTELNDRRTTLWALNSFPSSHARVTSRNSNLLCSNLNSCEWWGLKELLKTLWAFFFSSWQTRVTLTISIWRLRSLNASC